MEKYFCLATAAIALFLLGGAGCASHAQNLKSWSIQKDDAGSRFRILKDFNEEAVLDKETQLVWEKKPSTDLMPWNEAKEHCLSRYVGGRMGWRLPAIEEILTLVDRTESPALPNQHPFEIVENLYWSATTRQQDTTMAYELGVFGGGAAYTPKGNLVRAWCVRGGIGYDAF